jgi:hypothetical protein
MGERRFKIAEIIGRGDGGIYGAITESELRQRLFLVAKYLYTGGPKIDPIGILIHGDGEKEGTEENHPDNAMPPFDPNE